MDKVVHLIPADNLDRARKFYSNVFGWKMNVTPGIDYTLVGTVDTDDRGMTETAGAINGGILKRQEPVKSVVITINVADIDKAAERVEKGGGKVIRKKAWGEIGYAAYIKDTGGNVIGLWQDLR